MGQLKIRFSGQIDTPGKETGYNLMSKNITRYEDDHRSISCRRLFLCTFFGGVNAGTGEIVLKLEMENILYCSL